MRTRTLLAGATSLLFGVGAASNVSAQLQLKGSDTLEDVTRDAIAASGANITYVGGGSGAGENALTGGTQRISPMSRQLNSGVADATKCTASAQQLLIGLDGIAVLGASQTHGDSLDKTSATSDDCSDSVSGGKTISGIFKADGVTPCDAATDGCTTPGQYTFGSWKEVLAMVYGGLNHNSGGALNSAGGATCTYVAPPNEASADAACGAGLVCFPNNKCGDPNLVGRRNPNRVNCLSPVRQALVNSWGNLFSDAATGTSCRTGSCTKLRHAFRRDDLSGTTDTFVTLVGLPGIPGQTKAFVGSPSFVPVRDRQATANAFCNAGDRTMNKGDSDYLDLDPIRRSVDHQNVGGTRNGLEQVAEVLPAFGGNNNDALCNVDRDPATPGVQPPIPADRATPTQPGILPDPTITGSEALLQQDLGSNGTGGLLAAPYAASTRLCLGLVLPITIPANYQTAQQAFAADASGTPVACDILDPPGVGPGTAIASVIIDTQHSATALCPNGTHQPCDLPYKVDPTAPGGKNFNCISDQLNPNPSGIQDRRAFNLHPVDVTGHYLRDNYFNTNLTGLSATRQARVVSAYYRLHTTRTTNLNGSVPTGGPCRQFSSTEQIGCLVKANACSIGFAGREAADDVLIGTATNFAFRIEGITPSTLNIQNLVLAGGAPIYPMSRTLWLNSVVGFSSSSLTADEVALFNFENGGFGSTIDTIIQNRNFVQVPAGVTRLRACPAF